MSTLDLIFSVSKSKNNSNQVFKENWRGLYHKDAQFTYPSATLILPKKSKKKAKRQGR